MHRDRLALAPEPDESSRPAPIYALVSDLLRKALASGSIVPGAVLLEGPLAELLRTTRTPVRQALQMLEEEGLVSRFEGRGYLAGAAGAAPLRVTLDAAMLGLESTETPVRKAKGWEAIYDEVERDIVHLSVFGHGRINELELARHFGVGRMVARDVLLRLEGLGLIEKDERSRWGVTALDAARINHLYELRWLLEPAALRGAMTVDAKDAVDAMRHDLRRAMRVYPAVDRTMLDAMEHDLHVRFMGRTGNQELLHALARTRCILTLSKHVLGEATPMPKRDPFMAEHLAVLDALAEGDTAAACGLLQKHLELSCRKVTERAEQVRAGLSTPDLPYVD